MHIINCVIYLFSENLKELALLKQRNANLEKCVKRLEKENSNLQCVMSTINKIFTPGQVKRLQQPQKQAHWSADDIANAIAIFSAGARAYRVLLKKKYPLPAISTLRKWSGKIQIGEGILNPVLKIMEKSEFNELERMCVLSFDEMKIKKQYLYSKAKDATLKPANYVQVALIRGLFGNWKQPIFFDYDCSMSKKILMNIIEKVENANFNVVSVVCDLGGSNRGLLKELEISVQKSWFPNPKNANQRIHVFADVPHLIKLIRNNFIDHGFLINGNLIDKSIIEELISVTNEKSELSIAYKISAENLSVKNAGRQKVKLATKLFSHTVARAISRSDNLGKLSSKNASICSDFFKLVS